jgi:hypothetical protein
MVCFVVDGGFYQFGPHEQKGDAVFLAQRKPVDGCFDIGSPD